MKRKKTQTTSQGDQKLKNIAWLLLRLLYVSVQGSLREEEEGVQYWTPERLLYTIEFFLVNRKPCRKKILKNTLDYRGKRNFLEHSF